MPYDIELLFTLQVFLYLLLFTGLVSSKSDMLHVNKKKINLSSNQIIKILCYKKPRCLCLVL